MRLELVLDPDALRGWHLALVSRLRRQRRIDVRVRWDPHGRRPATPPETDRLLELERHLNGIAPGPSATVSPAQLDDVVAPGDFDAELVLDLAGQQRAGMARTWHVLFDGSRGEIAAVGALLDGRFPTVEVADAVTGAVVFAGLPGSEQPGIIVAALDDILHRSVDLVTLAVMGRRSGPVGIASPPPGARRGPTAHTAKAVARAAARRAFHLLYRSPHWRVGWRFVDGPDVIDTGQLGHGWSDLPDDGRHFYADPFPVQADGVTHLFVEDFDHRTGQAGISVVEFGDRGPIGIPRPVLEHDAHLSYPFVVEDRGEFWMIPESSGAGTVELYRAARFPDRWVLEEVLVMGPEVADATAFRHDGRWWLSGTVRRGGGSSSDALHLWTADSLQGPWRSHRRNPVLVDISSARPAGRVVTRAGRLVRPFQDGRGGYGAAMGLAEITRLDDDCFEQRVIARMGSGAHWPGSAVHTLNRAGRLECIDGSARSLRLRRGSTVGLLSNPRPDRTATLVPGAGPLG